jgi:signal-transduction protein with cAMP-binding, CBS, and nucleotidyltransferase domain
MKANVQEFDIAGVIARSPWFDDLPDDALERLVSAARIRSYRKGSFLYTTGEQSGDIFCILSGRVRMLLSSAIGQEYAIRDLAPEAWLGEQFLSGDSPTSLDAHIYEEATVLSIPRNIVLDVANQHPQIYRSLFEHTMANATGHVSGYQPESKRPGAAEPWVTTACEQDSQRMAGARHDSVKGPGLPDLRHCSPASGNGNPRP